jgi:hypothetical protein
VVSEGQRKYLEIKEDKKGGRGLRRRLRISAGEALEDLKLMGLGLEPRDHLEVFTYETVEPFFAALIKYSAYHKEDEGFVKNVRLFKLFFSMANMCLNGCRALFSPEFEKLMFGIGASLSTQELALIKIAYNSVLTPEEMVKTSA